MRSNATVSSELVFTDVATKQHQLRIPVINVIRGHLIANDGIFMTTGPNGPVAGYAARGWAHFPRKEMTKALKRSINMASAILPERSNSLTDGYVVQLHPDDALAYGVDLTLVNLTVGEDRVTWGGCIGITAQAYVFALTGHAPESISGATERSENDLTAIEITKGIESLRLGSTRTLAARPATARREAQPQITYPACAEGEVLVKGTAKKVEVEESPYANMTNLVVVGDVGAPLPSSRGFGQTFGRRRGR